MNTLIVYRSFLGSSRKYAEWLHAAVPSEIMKLGRAGKNELKQSDQVIIFGGTYAGHLSAAGFLKSKWSVLKNKSVVFVTVGGAPGDDQVSMRAFARIPEHIRGSIKHFHLRGKLGQTNIDEVKPEKIKPIAEYITA